MDSDQTFAAFVVACVTIVLLGITGGLSGYYAYETSQFVKGGYCQRSYGLTWIKCDMLKDVVMK